MKIPDKIRRYDFPDGYPGTAETVKLLARTVESRHLHPRMRDRMRQITRGLPSMDYDGEVARVWEFILAHVRYLRDPLGAEHITDPIMLDEMIEDGHAMEDCESIALYAATLLASAGIPSRFEIQGRDPSKPKRFTHCSLQVQNPRTKYWTSFDPIGAYAFPERFALGDTLYVDGNPHEVWNLDGERTLTSMLGDAFGDVTSDILSSVGTVFGALSSSGVPYVSTVGAIGQGAMDVGKKLTPSSETGTKSTKVLGPQMMSARSLQHFKAAKKESAATAALDSAAGVEKFITTSPITSALLAGGGTVLILKLIGAF